nr:putative integron gene cassette protein [uncultured bacterium]
MPSSARPGSTSWPSIGISIRFSGLKSRFLPARSNSRPGSMVSSEPRWLDGVFSLFFWLGTLFAGARGGHGIASLSELRPGSPSTQRSLPSTVSSSTCSLTAVWLSRFTSHLLPLARSFGRLFVGIVVMLKVL